MPERAPVRTALIVGAGIGGLAAAVALGRAGWRIRIYERASSPRELGFALNIAPTAMAALDELGLAQPIAARGHAPSLVEIRGANGRVLRRLNLEAVSHKARWKATVALRQVLHGMLVEAVAAIDPAALVLDHEVVALTRDGSHVAVQFKNGGSVTGDVLVGADGVQSVIRRHLHPDEPPPRPSGYWAVRGVADNAGGALGDLSAVAYSGYGVEAAAVRASRVAIYWYMSLLAEDAQPLARDPAALVKARAAGLDDTFRAVLRATMPGDLRVDELFDREPIARWGDGAATLLGDAAHPMLPHTGQGAGQALEDAVALGLVLAPHGDLAAALRRYEDVRAPRTAPIVRQGRRIARTTTTKQWLVGQLRTTAIRWLPASVMMRAFYLGGQQDPHRALRSSGSQARGATTSRAGAESQS
jgi:2-polyprenyl-6-methoxyphenol hydroxylase-like FAD-dependent oxidoreductase